MDTSIIKNDTREIYRILKKGGILILSIPNVAHLRENSKHPYYKYEYMPKELTRLLDSEQTFVSVEKAVEINFYNRQHFRDSEKRGLKGLVEEKPERLIRGQGIQQRCFRYDPER